MFGRLGKRNVDISGRVRKWKTIDPFGNTRSLDNEPRILSEGLRLSFTEDNVRAPKKKAPIYYCPRGSAEGRAYRMPNGCYNIEVIGSNVRDVKETIAYLEEDLGAVYLARKEAKK